MTDDFDIEAMLEEPFKKEEQKLDSDKKHSSKHDKDKERKRSKEKERKSDHTRHSKECHRSDRKSSRERRKNHDRSQEKKTSAISKQEDDFHSSRKEENSIRKRSKSRDKSKRQRSRSREKKRARSRERERRSRSRERRRRSRSPRVKSPELTVEERDVRTIFCMQLAARIQPRDLEDFFSSVGKVRDVKLIIDNKSHRSKGIAYIEFREIESVALAMGLSGQRLLGVPIIVQPSHGDRNRVPSSNMPANMKAPPVNVPPAPVGPAKLYIGSLHPNITEDMLRSIFEPFGPIDEVRLEKDRQTKKSLGYGVIQFRLNDDAKKATDQLNGFELAGMAMKICNLADYNPSVMNPPSTYDNDLSQKQGFNLTTTNKIQLMARLAEGSGIQLPQSATNVLNGHCQSSIVPPIATQCFMLSAMFDSSVSKIHKWETDLRRDVINECNRHGGVLHIYVDKTSEEGNVYVKCPSVASAASSVTSLHGKFFAGRLITAAYVPLPSYHSLFPDSINNLTCLTI